jgi:Na+/melibiose symporter-like transporter
MIITARKRIPNIWILLICLPWSAAMLRYLAMGGAFQFSLMKFVENPVGLTFIISLPGIISIVLNPLVNFLSDRVWTRVGRRKPFVIISWVGTMLCMCLMPLSPNMWTLVVLYMIYSIFNDIGQPMETLKMEVVPPKQRVTSAAVGNWIFNISILTFNFVAIGRFDDYSFMAGFPVTGEQSIYWTVVAAMLVMLLLITLGIRETNPKSALRGERFSLRNFFGAILNKNLWPVYMLIFGYAMMNSGLGAMTILLYIEQWGFTKQEMGINTAVGGVINCFLIVIMGCLCTNLPRMKTYQVLMALSLVVNFCFYFYVHFMIYDQRPSLVELIVFGETLSIMGILIGMVYMPMVYDYIPRNEMGTFAAGQNLLNRVVSLLTLNGVGLFVWGYATLFLPPGGETTRVTLRQEVPETEVAAILAKADLRDPKTDKPLELDTQSWYATGAALDHSRAFEIRAKNPDSISLRERREKLTEEQDKHNALERNARLMAETATQRGDTAAAEKQLKLAATHQADAAPVTEQIKRIDDDLQGRADKFHAQVATALGDRLVPDEDRISVAFTRNAWLFEYPVSGRPFAKHIEKTLDILWLEHPEIIDLRPEKRGQGYVLVMSADLLEGSDPAVEGKRLGEALFAAGAKRLGGVLTEAPVPVAQRQAPLIGLEMDIVEDPLDRFPSPITRLVNAILARFGDVAPPERRVFGLARGMRQAENMNHVGVRPTAADAHAIRVKAVMENPVAPPTDAVLAGQLGALLPGSSEAVIAQAAALYARTVEIAPQQRITPVRPLVSSSFAKMKYDYMSGYIWMFLLGGIGLWITFAFARREKRGLIHKRGLEEAEATEELPQSEVSAHPEEHSGEFYVPGHLWPKLGMAALGMALLGFSSVNLVPAFKLMLFGERAQVEAVRVVKQKIDGDSVAFTTDAEVLANIEKRDRSYVFWNEYHFTDKSGKDISFRAPAGSQLKPAHNLFDTDGLPYVATIYYNPKNSRQVVLPGEFSTWFMPGILAVFGLLGTIVGLILAWNANKPIAVPHIAPAPSNGETSRP